MRTRGENFLKEEEALLFSERGFFRGVGGKFVFLGSLGAWLHMERKKSVFGFCKMVFPLERGSAGQGGRGDSDLPPMPPWTPYTPFKRPRDTPGPPLVPEGTRPLASRPTGSVSYPTFGLAWGQQPIGCRNGHALCMAPMPRRIPLHKGTAVAAPCLHSKDRPAPWSRGRDQLRRRRQWPSQGRT